ncbi:MAG: hypothetical protein HY657_08520 [Acidobacteria bacterium]|nr:hypothetical protein [Acidobacteriota bacterium]
MTLDEATAKLQEVPCPYCLSLGGLAIMVCGPGRGDCESIGQCLRCGYKFNVEFAAATLARLKEEQHVRERSSPCPACGAPEPEIHFACDTQKYSCFFDCFFVATCRACGHTFRIHVSTDDPMRPRTGSRAAS